MKKSTKVYSEYENTIIEKINKFNSLLQWDGDTGGSEAYFSEPIKISKKSIKTINTQMEKFINPYQVCVGYPNFEVTVRKHDLCDPSIVELAKEMVSLHHKERERIFYSREK